MISMRHALCPMRRNKDELEWFSTTRCHLYNGASIKKHSSVMMFDYRCVSHKLGVTFENQSTNGEWSMEERKKLIDWLELKTVLLELQSFLSSACGGNVIKVFCAESVPLRDLQKCTFSPGGQPTCMHGDLVYLRVHLQTPFHRATYTSRARLQ